MGILRSPIISIMAPLLLLILVILIVAQMAGMPIFTTATSTALISTRDAMNQFLPHLFIFIIGVVFIGAMEYRK